MRDNARETVEAGMHEALVRLAVDGLADHAFVTLDAQGIITSWNLGAERLLGWPRERAICAHVSIVLGPGGPDPGIGAPDLQHAEQHGSVTRPRRLNRH